jgi:hypothetical protein
MVSGSEFQVSSSARSGRKNFEGRTVAELQCGSNPGELAFAARPNAIKVEGQRPLSSRNTPQFVQYRYLNDRCLPDRNCFPQFMHWKDFKKPPGATLPPHSGQNDLTPSSILLLHAGQDGPNRME